jgi:HK97 family phage portal protein
MGILDKVFSIARKKDVIQEGGLELLAKLTGTTLSPKGHLEQYGKSLYVFACVSKIAEKVASTQAKFFRIVSSKGDVKEVVTHPALDLMYRPNPFQTKSELWETMMINLKLTGDAFWFKVRNKGGRVVELWNLRPDMVTIITDPTAFIKEYQFTKSDGAIVHFAPEDVIHFKYTDPLSAYLGMSPLRAAQIRVQTEGFAAEYQRDFFLNSARPDALIKNPQNKLTAEQKTDLRDGWNKKYRGPGNNSKVAILSGGLEYEQISLNQKEMDFIESQKFTRDDILVAFKVPKVILSIVEDVNRANAETGMYIFLSETIKPDVVRIFEKLNEELIYPDFGEEFYLDFVDMTPQNRELQLKEYSEGIVNNYLLINEVRARENLPPVKGGWSFYMPLINQAVGGLPQAEQKALAAKVMKQSDENARVIEQTNLPKQYDFAGRFWLKQKLEIREELEKKVMKSLAGKKIKRAKRKKAWKPLIVGDELRNAYANMINKKLDQSAAKLKDASDAFFAGQQARVEDALGNVKTKARTKKVTVTVEMIYDAAKEEGLSIEFITPYLQQLLEEAGAEAMNMVAPQEDFKDTARIRALIKQRAEEFAMQVSATTIGKLASTLAEGVDAAEGIADLSKRVADVYGEFPSYRSELIARTEATAANNQGMIEAFKQSEVATGKEWINAGDSRVRDEHQDGIGVGGEIVGLDAAFSNGLQFPQEPNCRCVLGPAFLE